jgi:AcrR family transcriptional regulator
VAKPAPAYTRLDVDERRAQLLDLGVELFARHAYDELSMAAIAREAKISKALLYHYFPSKQAYFVATLRQKAEELAALTASDPALPPADQLARSLDAFLGWVEANAGAYAKLVRGASAVPEVRAVVDQVREDTAQRILAGIVGGDEPPPALGTAVRGWLWFMDGAILDWIERRAVDRAGLHRLLLGALTGAVAAAGVAPERAFGRA